MAKIDESMNSDREESRIGDFSERELSKKVKFLVGAKIAHRGKFDNKAGVPENSLVAFRRAVKAGVAIELDVHLTRDGKVVVFHDAGLRRMTGKKGKITKLNFLEIRELRLKGTEEKIPELREVLEIVGGEVPIIIEVKFDRMPGKLERELVKILDKYKGEFAVKSFSPATMRWFYRHRPKYVRGLLVGHEVVEFLVTRMIFMRWVKPEFLSVNYKFYKSRKIQKVRRRMPVVAWTIRSKKAMKKAKGRFDGWIVEGAGFLEE